MRCSIRLYQIRFRRLKDEPLRLFQEAEDDRLERNVGLHVDVARVRIDRDGDERWRGLHGLGQGRHRIRHCTDSFGAWFHLGSGCGGAVGIKGIPSPLPAPTLCALASSRLTPVTDAAPVAVRDTKRTDGDTDAGTYSLGVCAVGAHPALTDGDSDAECRLTSCRGNTNTVLCIDESATEDWHIKESVHSWSTLEWSRHFVASATTNRT